MKVKTLFIVSCLFCSTLGWGSVGLGIELGGACKTFTLSDQVNNDVLKNKLSWQAGVYSCMKFAPDFFINPELLLSRYASTLADRYGGQASAWSFIQTELQMPLLVKWQFLGPTRNWTPCLLFGPSLHYTLSSRFSLTIDGQREDFAMEPELTRFHTSLVIGSGVELPVKLMGARIHAEIRYSAGLTNQLKDKNLGTYKSNSVQFQLGALF